MKILPLVAIVITLTLAFISASHASSPVPVTKCGSEIVVAKRIEKCIQVLVDLLEGSLPKWPKTPNDIISMCDEYERGERCIKDVSRQCLTGLQRTIVSTFASAVQRTRKKECLPEKYPQTLKAVQCVEKNQPLAHKIMYNVSDHLHVISDQITNLDSKTTHICCMLDEIENNIKYGLGVKCPKDVLVLTRLYKSALEDVTNLICRNPKCNDLFKGYQVKEAKQHEGVVSLIIQIIFSIARG